MNKFKDDDTGMKMGDLLNSETLQDKMGVNRSINAYNPNNLPDLLTIFMQGNSYIIGTMETLLAVAADTSDNTWIDRFAQMDYDSLLDQLEEERPDLNTETKRVQYLDSKYGDTAMTLASQVSSLRAELIGFENTGIDFTKMTEETIKDKIGDAESVDDETLKGKIDEKTLELTEAGLLYETLKNYEGGSFKKGELLSFFMEEADVNDTDRYIPMAAALSDGQRGGMEFVNLKELIRYAFLNPDELEKQFKSNETFKDLDNKSVYSGVNRELFYPFGSVAYTNGAVRERNFTKKSFSIFDKEWLDENILFFGTWTATILSFMAWQGSKLAYKSISAEVAERLTRNPHFWDTDLDHSLVFMKVFKYACIFFVIAAVITTIYKYSKTEEVKLEPIPKYFVDAYTEEDGSYTEIYYEAAKCNRSEYNQNKKQGGESADICADEGKQWLALYVSKNSKAGNPVIPDFTVEKKSDASGGRKGCIHLLREKGALNLGKAEYRNYSELYSAYNTIKNIFADDNLAYVFYQRSDTAKIYDESAGNMTASALGDGMWAIFGFGGLVIGGALGAVIAVLINKNKKKKETA